MRINFSDMKFYKIMGKVQSVIISLLAVIIPLLITAQVILRYVLKMPLFGIEELMLFPIIWLYMLGGANASMERNHISCGILTLYIKKEKSIAIFNFMKALISVVISMWLTYWAFWYFSYSLKMWKLSDLLYLPMFFAESAIFIGLVLMVFYALVELYDMVLDLMDTEKKAEV